MYAASVLSRIRGIPVQSGISSADFLVTTRMSLILIHEPFVQDLCRSISTRFSVCDSVIFGIDHNDDVRTGELALKLKSLGLIDSILSQHPSTGTQPRHQLMHYEFLLILVFRGGFCAFGDSHGMQLDHRQLWIKCIIVLSWASICLPPIPLQAPL